MTHKPKPFFVCQHCGHQTPKWMGRCPDCGQWGGMVEELPRPKAPGDRPGLPWAHRNPCRISPRRRKTGSQPASPSSTAPGRRRGPRLPGAHRGGPGHRQIHHRAPGARPALGHGLPHTLSFGEESPQQIRLRAERLSALSSNLFVLTVTCIEDVVDELDRFKPDLIAVDSIPDHVQFRTHLRPRQREPGPGDGLEAYGLREAHGGPGVLVGHVTKEGAIAGPKVLEHLVDTVLYFEGDRGHAFRVLRAVKNRYGSTNEIGVFEMKIRASRRSVTPPGSSSKSGRRRGRVRGSAMPGGNAPRPGGGAGARGHEPPGMPRRTSLGIDHNRISLLVAVLGKKMGMELGDQDIFVKVAGGLKVEEPAADLGIIAGMMSSFLENRWTGTSCCSERWGSQARFGGEPAGSADT